MLRSSIVTLEIPETVQPFRKLDKRNTVAARAGKASWSMYVPLPRVVDKDMQASGPGAGSTVGCRREPLCGNVHAFVGCWRDDEG